MQISRFLNTIRANQRQILRIPHDDDPANKRDRIELILYHASIVFEAIKKLLENSQRLSSLNAWKRECKLVEMIQNEFNNNSSFTNKYLKRVRNKLIFHYDIEPIREVLKTYPINEHTVFAEAKSISEIDIAFVLADELLVNYLVPMISERQSDIDKWTFFNKTLLSISNDPAELLNEIIGDLLVDYLVVEDEN